MGANLNVIVFLIQILIVHCWYIRKQLTFVHWPCILQPLYKCLLILRGFLVILLDFLHRWSPRSLTPLHTALSHKWKVPGVQLKLLCKVLNGDKWSSDGTDLDCWSIRPWYFTWHSLVVKNVTGAKVPSLDAGSAICYQCSLGK